MEILSLGEKIKRRRKELNMTLKDLAGERITPGQISLVESNKSNPSMDLLEYLAAMLNTPIEYFMESEETQAEKICVFFENIAESCILNEDLQQGEQYIERALYYAERYNLEYRKARNLYLRGSLYMVKQEMGLAQQFLLSANVIFIKNNHAEEVISTFIKLGKITLGLKAYHSSCSYFQQAEKVFDDSDIGNDFLLGEIYYYEAYTYFKLDNLEKAINYSFLATEKFKQIDNKREYAKSLLLLAQEFNEKGDVNNAIKYSKKTLKIFKELNDAFYIGEIENDLGRLFYEFDNLEESFIHLNKAKEVRKLNRDGKLIDTLIYLCDNHIKLKEISKAKEVIAEIMDNIEGGNEKGLIEYYLLKYRIHMLESDLNEAENTLHMALNFVKNMDSLKDMAEIHIMLGKFYIDAGRGNEAAQNLNEGVELFKKLGVIRKV